MRIGRTHSDRASKAGALLGLAAPAHVDPCRRCVWPKPRPGATGGSRLSGGFPRPASTPSMHLHVGSCINPAVSVVSHFRPWRQPSAKSCPSFADRRAMRPPLAIHRPWRLPGLWIASRRVPIAQKCPQSRIRGSTSFRHLFKRCQGVCGALALGRRGEFP